MTTLAEPLADPEPSPFVPSFAQRLTGNTPGGLGGVDAQWSYAAAESHHLGMSFLLPMTCDSQKDYEAAAKEWRSYRWRVVYNPFYWPAWLATVLLIMLGRRLHYIADQHEPIAVPESHTEHEIRVWWIYPSDGAFAGGLFLVACDALWYAGSGKITESDCWSMLVISVVIYSSIITSNFLFLNAMRQRSSLHVKMFVAGNAALALALTILLITSGVRIATGNAPPSIRREMSGHGLLYVLYTWALRVGFVFFMVLMAATYFRLWFAYDPNGLRLSQVLSQPHLDSTVAGSQGSAEVAGDRVPAETVETGEALRSRTLSVSSKQRAVKYHFISLLAAFFTSAFVLVLLFAASCLNTEGLWEALA